MPRLHKLAGALVLAFAFIAMPTASFAAVFVNISVGFGPPAIPIYVQPAVPAPNLIWTPGYWAYGPYGYYWVPGTWVAAPEVGYLWTPGYWAYNGDAYIWNQGYWGTQVGYYGGINYGFGYFGSGFYGGGWQGNNYRYNTAYTNVNQNTVHAFYTNRAVANSFATGNRASFNGRGGIVAQPTSSQVAFAHQRHIGVTSVQAQHIQVAAANRNFLAKVNNGRPANPAFAAPLAATHRPANFAPITAAHTTTVTRKATTTTFRAPATTTRKTAATFHAPATTHTVTTHAATTYHAPVTTHAVTTHAVTTYHAPVTTTHKAAVTTFRAPVQHAAVQHAPVQHAPVQHAMVHAAPAAHGPPARPGPEDKDKH